MEYAKKYALVPEESLSRHTPTPKQMSEFDKEMSHILNSTLNDYEKVQQYYMLLQKKLNLENFNSAFVPTSMVDGEKKNTPPKEESQQLENISPIKYEYETIVLRSLPKSLKNMGESLLQILRTHPEILSWNSQGEISIKGKIIPNSNLADLVSMILTNKKKTDYVGKQNFLSTLQELNVPQLYFKNKHLLSTKEEFTPPTVIKQEPAGNLISRKSEKRPKTMKGTGRVKCKWIKF